MIPFALTFAAFAVWTLVGLGLLVAIGADSREPRLILTTPLIGSALMLLCLFVLSHAGLAMDDVALPTVVLLIVSSATIVVFRRPGVPVPAVGIAVLAVVGAFLVGWPFFTFGFDWLANGNDDMANYVLSATKLLHHGLLMQMDVAGIRQDRDYASALQNLHSQGARPGSDIMLAGFAGVVGRPPYQLFMPLIVAFNMTAVFGGAALAMQASRKWRAAYLAALLLITSPLAAFGVVQQLLPQVWGLGLATGIFALIVRQKLHGRPD